VQAQVLLMDEPLANLAVPCNKLLEVIKRAR
jgi:ABC-type sugar transport system ATPase subunit